MVPDLDVDGKHKKILKEFSLKLDKVSKTFYKLSDKPPPLFGLACVPGELFYTQLNIFSILSYETKFLLQIQSSVLFNTKQKSVWFQIYSKTVCSFVPLCSFISIILVLIQQVKFNGHEVYSNNWKSQCNSSPNIT